MTTPDDVRTPSDLADALRDADMLDVFEDMAPSHRREYIDWIAGAKQTATRERRISNTIERLADQFRS